jgi:hypothetical protein
VLRCPAVHGVFWPLTYQPDDAFFYLRVARHLAAGDGSTFNGVIPTNGYHPLWQWLLAALSLLTANDRVFMVVAILFAGALLLAAMAVGLHAVAQAGSHSGWIVIACLGLGVGALQTWLTEAHLSALCAMACMSLTLCKPARSVVVGLGAGALLGFWILARVDAALFAIAVLVVLALHWRSRGPTLAAVGGCALVVAPYLVWSWSRFGHLMPISASIKQSFPNVSFDWARPGPVGLALLGLAIAAGLVSLLDGPAGHFRRAAGLLLAAVLIQGLLVMLYGKFDRAYHWYWVPATAYAALFGAFAVDHLVDRVRLSTRVTRALSLGGIAVGIGVPLAVATLRTYRSPDVAQAVAPALWLQAHVSRDARVFADDAPGVLGYWTHVRIIPVDGLMGDFEFQRTLVESGIECALARADARYFFDTGDCIGAAWEGGHPPASGQRGRLRVWSTIGERDGGVLDVDPADEVGRLWFGGQDIARLWKLHPQCRTSLR